MILGLDSFEISPDLRILYIYIYIYTISNIEVNSQLSNVFRPEIVTFHRKKTNFRLHSSGVVFPDFENHCRILYPQKTRPCGTYWWDEGPYLCLDAVQTSEPEDLASSQLHFSVIDLISALCQLLLVDLLLCDAMTGLFQELQAMGWDGCDQLTKMWKAKFKYGQKRMCPKNTNKWSKLTEAFKKRNKAADQRSINTNVYVIMWNRMTGLLNVTSGIPNIIQCKINSRDRHLHIVTFFCYLWLTHFSQVLFSDAALSLNPPYSQTVIFNVWFLCAFVCTC